MKALKTTLKTFYSWDNLAMHSMFFMMLGSAWGSGKLIFIGLGLVFELLFIVVLTIVQAVKNKK